MLSKFMTIQGIPVSMQTTISLIILFVDDSILSSEKSLPKNTLHFFKN